MRFDDYMAKVDLPSLANAMSAWTWLEKLTDLRAVGLTLTCDVFLIDRTNAVYFLDTNFGVVEKLATGNDDFRARLQDEAFTRSLVRMNLVQGLRAKGVDAKPGQCFSVKIPPLLGGSLREDLEQPTDFVVVLRSLASWNLRARDYLVGQEFQLEAGDDPEIRTAFPGKLRKFPRDRESFAISP